MYEEMREKNRRQRSGEALEEGRGRRRREPEAYERRKLKEGRRLRRRRSRRTFLAAAALILFLSGGAAGWFLRGSLIREPVNPSSVETPEWVTQDLLTLNDYSRPGTKLSEINGIVVHYVGNPGTTARQNRNYFEGLKDQTGSNRISVSSNFIIGMDGEIIQCVPIDEMAYASNTRNSDTVSIECCHPGKDGRFTEETYASLVRLTAWLCRELDLKPKDVIRHYDITEKACPKYFVDHPDEWKEFLNDVREAMKE